MKYNNTIYQTLFSKWALTLLVVYGALAGCAPKKDLSWIAIGDSITYLDAHPDETGNRITKGYMARVAKKLPHIHYVNQGHNGWTSTEIAHSLEKLDIKKADIYTVFLGTNDWWRGVSLGKPGDTGDSTLYGAYHVIIKKLRGLNSDAHIILVTPIQRGDFVYIKNFKNNAYGSYKSKNGRTLAQFADAIKDISQTEHLQLVDLYYRSGITPVNVVKYKRLRDTVTGQYKAYPYPAYTAVPFNPATDNYPYPPDAIDMTYDGLHPSDKGFTVIADMLVKVMKKY